MLCRRGERLEYPLLRDVRDQDRAHQPVRRAALVLLPVAPRGHPGEQASGPHVRVLALSRCGATVTVWGCARSASTELQAGACKSRVHSPGCASCSGPRPRSRVPHLTVPIIPAHSEAIPDASAGSACFWACRRRGCPCHPVLGFTVSGVSPMAQSQACLRGHSLACPWGAWPLCRRKGPCRGPGAPGAGWSAGALGEAEMHTGCWGGWEVVPGEGCRVLHRSTSPLSRGVLHLCCLGLCPHTGRERGLPVQLECGCVRALRMPGAASCCSGLGMRGVHPQHRAGFVWWGL